METTLVQAYAQTSGQGLIPAAVVTPRLRPARLVIDRPQARCSVKVIWDCFRMSKAWGEAMELYDLGRE